jgi:hypothetical protein
MDKTQDSYLVGDVDTSTVNDGLLRFILVIIFVSFFLVVLVGLMVYWLSFNHPDLKPIVLAGFVLISNIVSGVVGHYLGVQTTVTTMLHRR